ncbi:unnamed protein product [Brassica rapa subsp. trilocularis]
MVDECENRDGATAARSYSHQGHKTKEAGDSSDGVDSISFLPDVILQSILSSLPTEIAIKTSILSKRWRHVWSDIHLASPSTGLGHMARKVIL